MQKEEIILGTGNYEFVETGNRVSIDRDGGNLWCYYGETYKKLAPELLTYQKYIKNYHKLQSIKQDTEEYILYQKQIEDEFIRSYYETKLRKINSYKLLEDLNEQFGKDIILLSREEIDTFSHRRLLVDYIELETGIYIPEVTISKEGKIRKLTPKSYKDRLEKIIDNNKW